MPKKNSSWGTNSKSDEARERKADKKHADQKAKAKAKEDAYWHDEGTKVDQRKQARKQNEQQKKADALARKQEAKRLLDEEEAKTHTKTVKGPTKAAPKKVTQSEIDKIKEEERKRIQDLAAAREREQKKITENPEIEEENPNRKMAELLAEEGAVEARAVEEAISVLAVEDGSGVDKHPEKRMKAAYNEFEQRELPKLKAEYPNLRLSQLKQMLRKEWQKSPDNPMNKR